MVSIRQLNAGDTVHIILRRGYPLKHTVVGGVGQWNIVSAKTQSTQAQDELTNFAGRVASSANGVLKLYGGAETGQGIHQSMRSGSTAGGVGLATVPWNFIWKAWRINFEYETVNVTTHGPNPPDTSNETTRSRTKIIKEKIKIP